MSRKRILFLQKRLLFPTDSGGKIRTLNVLRHLAKWHDITYLCNILPEERLHVGEMEGLGLNMVTVPWTEAPRPSLRFYWGLLMNLLSPYPFNVNKDFDRRLRKLGQELLGNQKFDLLICDFVQMARNCIGLDSIPTLLFQHNVESQIFQRLFQQERKPAHRAYLWLQWKKMHHFENRAGRCFDGVVAVSENDRETFRREYGWKHVHVIDTAVDTSYFFPFETRETPRQCVFTGSMDWPPNEEGVRFFAREIWPLIRSRYDDATFVIVGRNPPKSLLALNGKSGIEVTGAVPDVRPFIAKSQVNVVPLLVGGGTRLKVFESMAMRKPVVSTRLGVEGLPVRDKHEVLIADSAESFAEAVCALFHDAGLRHRLACESLELVLNKHAAPVIAQQFNEICHAIAR